MNRINFIQKRIFRKVMGIHAFDGELVGFSTESHPCVLYLGDVARMTAALVSGFEADFNLWSVR